MRNLKELFANNESVWLLCETEALQKQFLSQAEEEGFLAMNGDHPSDLSFQPLYGLHDDMTMGYLSVMIWSMTFPENGEDSHFRVNYGKYIAGEDDYICHTPHFSPVIR